MMMESSPLPPIEDLQKIAPLVDTYCPLCEVCIGDAQVKVETAKTEFEASAQDVVKLVRDSMGPYRICKLMLSKKSAATRSLSFYA